MVVVGFEITGIGSDGDDSTIGKNITYYGMIEPEKSLKITAERLKVLGFDGEDLFSIVKNSRPVRIKIENIPPVEPGDRPFCRVSGIYSLDGGTDGVNPSSRTLTEEERENAISRITRILEIPNDFI
jgi:hypothetical protein